MWGAWQTRQRSVGCISPHTWKLPLVMALCILVYTLPLSLAVSVESPSGPTTASDPTGPGGPSDAVVTGILSSVASFLGVLILGGIAIWAAWYQNRKKKNEALNNQRSTPTGSTPTGSIPIPTRSVTTPVGSSPTLTDIDKLCIDTYVRSLKSMYRQKIQITDDKRWRGRPTSPRYINLTVVRKDDIDKSEMDKSTKMCGNIDKKGSLELKDLDQLEDGSKAKCVLVQGAPGIGKTTMAQELCKQWAEGKLFKHYLLLVLLKLRNKSVQSAKDKKDLFLYSSDPSAVASVVENHIEKETAFLLDGFDELPQELQKDSIFVKLIKKELFPDACVIITSRPSVIDILCKHCSEHSYQHEEVLGFTEEQRNNFVEAWFDENVEECSRADERRQFESYLELYPHIHALMYIPLNCSIVIDVYQSSKASVDSIIPTTQTELYRQYTLTILNRYQPKRRKPQNLEAIPPEDQENLKKISKLAYDGIAHLPQKLIFQEEDIPQDPNVKSGMGFMDTDYDERSESYSHNFLHLTIQEFLAAYYISTLEPSEQIRRIEDSLDKRHLEIMLRFFAGITKFQSSDGSRTPVEWLQTYYESGGKLECLRWMFEAQDQGLITEVLGNSCRTQDLDLQTLAPFECYVLGYCIAKSDCQWKLKCTLGEEGMKMMVSGGSEGCLHNVQVIDLNLSDLKAGVKHLVSALKGNTVLTELKLECCNIDADGISDLAPALSINTTLRVLDLTGNPISSQGAEHLALLLEKTCSLTELVLIECHIGDDGACQLARAICANSTLKKLDLTDNPLGERGTQELVKSLAHNSIIEQIVW